MAILKNSNILVTGATGFLGSNLVGELVKLEANVYSLAHNRKKTFPESIANSEVIYGDITDFDSIRNILSSKQIEYIFHCAANPIVKYCSKDPLSCLQVNVMGTAHVLEAARIVGGVKGIMCMDSDKSYGHNLNQPLKETSALQPYGIYEASKACSGYVAESYRVNFGLPVFNVRSANLYGPGDANVSRLIPGTISKVIAGQKPFLYEGVADYLRDFLFITDACQIMIQLMQLEYRGIINIGTGESHRIESVFETIFEVLDWKQGYETRQKESTHLEIKQQVLNTALLLEQIPGYQFIGLKEGIEKTIGWYRET